MLTQINNFITWFDGVVWGLPLIILILITGILLTVRLGLLQVRHLGKALKFMVKNEEGGEGEYKRGSGYEYLQKISYYTGWKYECELTSVKQ